MSQSDIFSENMVCISTGIVVLFAHATGAKGVGGRVKRAECNEEGRKEGSAMDNCHTK